MNYNFFFLCTAFNKIIIFYLLEKIEEMLKQTKEDIEAAQQRLTDWLALVNKNADGYDQGDHAQTLIDLDSALLKEEFDELKDVCEAYIAHCITDEKNKVILIKKRMFVGLLLCSEGSL